MSVVVVVVVQFDVMLVPSRLPFIPMGVRVLVVEVGVLVLLVEPVVEAFLQTSRRREGVC